MFAVSTLRLPRKPAKAAVSKKVVQKTRAARKKIEVAVISSSYSGVASATADVDTDGDNCSPAYWVKRHKAQYRFSHFLLDKATCYRKLRELFAMKKFDVFYNLCDGAKDEARAGVEVIKVLEEENQAYTGADSRGFEPCKVTMKMALSSTNVKYPNFVPLHPGDSTPRLCAHLKFPVIVKHKSGYASVGITAQSKCNNMRELRVQVKKHMDEYKHALVEEFICGREGTVFVCASRSSECGIKVFPPIMMDLGGPGDFAHFENKWVTNSFVDESTKPKALPEDDPAYDKIQAMARAAFSNILHGVGYGRCDFRIDDRTGEPYFLEINPNCGMLYPKESGGCYADVMVGLDKDWDHDTFISSQINTAMEQRRAREPWTTIAFNQAGKWAARAAKNVSTGQRLFPDSTKVIPVTVKTLFDVTTVPKSRKSTGMKIYEGPVGCAVYRSDGIADTAVPLLHSCDPNMALEGGLTNAVVARRSIKKGTFLSLDYATIADPTMPTFRCHCGSKHCRGLIASESASTRASPTTRIIEAATTVGGSMASMAPFARADWGSNVSSVAVPAIRAAASAAAHTANTVNPPNSTSAAAAAAAGTSSSPTSSPTSSSTASSSKPQGSASQSKSSPSPGGSTTKPSSGSQASSAAAGGTSSASAASTPPGSTSGNSRTQRAVNGSGGGSGVSSSVNGHGSASSSGSTTKRSNEGKGGDTTATTSSSKSTAAAGSGGGSSGSKSSTGNTGGKTAAVAKKKV